MANSVLVHKGQFAASPTSCLGGGHKFRTNMDLARRSYLIFLDKHRMPQNTLKNGTVGARWNYISLGVKLA